MNELKRKLTSLPENYFTKSYDKEIRSIIDYFNESNPCGFTAITYVSDYTIGLPIIEDGEDDSDYEYDITPIERSDIHIFINDMVKCLDEYNSDLVTYEYGVYEDDEELHCKGDIHMNKFVYFTFSKK
jgi:hypothetical protein